MLGILTFLHFAVSPLSWWSDHLSIPLAASIICVFQTLLPLIAFKANTNEHLNDWSVINQNWSIHKALKIEKVIFAEGNHASESTHLF